MKLHAAIRLSLFVALPLLVLGTACRRVLEPEEGGQEGLLMLSAETKALPAGVETFRVALFTENREYSGRNGTYCTEKLQHTDNYTDPGNPTTYYWLKPCRVNDSGAPLLANGDPAGSVAVADHDGKWGLRWSSYYNDSWAHNVELVALAPAVSFVHENGTHAAYVEWKPETEVYISEPVTGSFSGTWFKGQFVYKTTDADPTTSELSETLVDHRATVSIKVQCDRIPSTILRAVFIKHRIIRDRFYLEDKENDVRGFSLPAHPHYKFDDDDGTGDPVPGDFNPLYLLAAGSAVTVNKADYPTAGNPEHTWQSSSPFYLQARDYNTAAVDELRPLIYVQLGPDPLNPITVRIPIDYDLEPMKNYTLILDVSNTYVTVLCSVSNWENGGGGRASTETPSYLGTFQIDGTNGEWEDNGNQGADPL